MGDSSLAACGERDVFVARRLRSTEAISSVVPGEQDLAALRLWLKNVKFLDHPRYQNLSYRDEALKRDLEIRYSCSFLQKQKANNQGSSVTEVTTDNSDNRENGDKNTVKRWCVWRDAQWPWS